LGPWDHFCPKNMGHPREFKNCTITLKFGTLVDWMNTMEIFFPQNRDPFLGQRREVKNGPTILKFTTLL